MRKLTVDDLSASTHAVVVGIGSFSRTDFRPLIAPEREALSITNALRDPNGCAVPASQVTTLTGADGTRSSVEQELATVARSLSPRDILFVYFSGHGAKDVDDFYLCPFDVDATDLPHSAVSGRRLAEILSTSQARGIIVVLDCCVSAGFAEHAPDFFRALGHSDFRILLSASRENQKSWESIDGQGTLFSRHLVAVLEGREPAGSKPGHITFSGVLEAIDFGMKEDLASYANLPIQDSVFAGVYGRDPLLFVNRRAAVAGITVDSARVTRIYLYRVLGRSLILLLGAAAFVVGTYIAWLDSHEYAAADGNQIYVFRGYPAMTGFGYPHRIREIEYSAGDMQPDSSLRRGAPLVAAMGKTVVPQVYAELRPEYRALRYVVLGDYRQARTLAFNVIQKAVLKAPVQEPLLIASMVLPDITVAGDEAALRPLLDVDRTEVRTKALEALLKIAPHEALEHAIADSLHRLKFEHVDVLHEMQVPCQPLLASYFSELLDASDAHNIVGAVLDTSLRLRCPIGATGLLAAVRATPISEGDYTLLAARAMPRAEVSDSLMKGRHDRSVSDWGRAKIVTLQADLGMAPCAFDDLGPLKDDLGALVRARLFLSACPGSVLEKTVIGPEIEIRVARNGQKILQFLVSLDSLEPSDGEYLVRLVRDYSVTDRADFLKVILRFAGDAFIKAKAVDALHSMGIPYDTTIQPAYGNSLTLRRSLLAWWASSDPRAAMKFVEERFADGDMFDIETLMSATSPSPEELVDIRRRLSAGPEERKRAAAILAMHASAQEVTALLESPERQIAEASAKYVGFNANLSLMASELVANDDLLRRQVERLARLRLELETEIDSFPPDLRERRASLILAHRKTVLTDARNGLSPGIVLWLRQRYRVRGDVGL